MHPWTARFQLWTSLQIENQLRKSIFTKYFAHFAPEWAVRRGRRRKSRLTTIKRPKPGTLAMLGRHSTWATNGRRKGKHRGNLYESLRCNSRERKRHKVSSNAGSLFPSPENSKHKIFVTSRNRRGGPNESHKQTRVSQSHRWTETKMKSNSRIKFNGKSKKSSRRPLFDCQYEFCLTNLTVKLFVRFVFPRNGFAGEFWENLTI